MRCQESADWPHSRKIAQCEREPWLLGASVSLAGLSGAGIVALYAKRMQIEQSFRDLKSHRYGAAATAAQASGARPGIVVP